MLAVASEPSPTTAEWLSRGANEPRSAASSYAAIQ